jgi:hypothetical protein
MSDVSGVSTQTPTPGTGSGACKVSDLPQGRCARALNHDDRNAQTRNVNASDAPWNAAGGAFYGEPHFPSRAPLPIQRGLNP